MIDGRGKLNGPGKVDVTKDGKAVGSFAAKHVILATGARPRALPGIEPDGKLIWTYFEALVPETMPKSLLVIGSGAIGIEFASFFLTMGADVTVVEVMARIMPVEDVEISTQARKRMEKLGMKILTGAKVTGVEKAADSVTATIEDAKGEVQKITADRVISAVGVQGNIEDIGLGDDQGQNRPGHDRCRRLQPYRRAGGLRHRRCGGTADARPQGRA